MYKKKKNPNKENSRTTKKVPLITVPCFNATEEIRIPTLANNQLKSMVRSIELKKAALPNPYKKSVSRKSTCKSVKQGGPHRPAELKTIMQTFKQLKLMHQNQRSKSKSPASCKSRSTKKYFPNQKRKSHATLITKPNSEINLSLKLEKTIKQLNMTDFFRDEDSLLPIKSSSDIFQDEDPARVSTPDNEEDIDLTQLRRYCSTNIKPQKPPIELSLKNYNSFKENRAALKIQTAWKRYQTRRLVSRYIHIYNQQIHMPYIEPEGRRFSEQSPMEEVEAREDIVVSSEEFYPQGIEKNKVRHVSNLEEQISGSSEYEQAVKRIKMQELQKWNEIIKIISLNKSDNPAELERLLQKLTEQSELNKKDLEIKAASMLNNNRKRSFKTEEEAERGSGREAKREHTASDHSMALEEYDSKKYIQYLDGDIFPTDNEQHSQGGRGVKISKRKQEMLLQELKMSSLPIKLGEDSLYHCESMKSFKQGHIRHNSKSSSRSSLRKSTSEKILRSSREHMGVLEEMEETSQINLDLLTKEFLQGSDPSCDDFDMVYSQEKLKSKLAELSRMKEEYQNEENAMREEERLFIREEDEEESADEMSQLRRSHPSFQLHNHNKAEIKIEDGTPEKLQVEVVEAEIASDSDDAEHEEPNESAEAVADIVLNTLLMEVLRDIARSQKVSQAFKAFSLSLKPKIRKFQGNKKKKGFPTSKAEIQLFLQGLVKYLGKEQPNIFHNLQVSTGPSALQMLRYMHQSGEQEVDESDSQQDEANVMVIPNRVFDAFWQLKERSIVIEVPQHFDQSNAVIFKHQFQLLKSFNKIFYRSLFDTFNECLDCERNFGQYGRPFPWKRAPVFHHKRSESALQSHVEQARKKMVQLSTTYCGLIIEKEDMVNAINQEYIKQVHEDRLSRMLANDLIEAQDRWVFYDDEQTEILVQISNALYTELLIEVIEQLYEGL